MMHIFIYPYRVFNYTQKLRFSNRKSAKSKNERQLKHVFGAKNRSACVMYNIL